MGKIKDVCGVRVIITEKSTNDVRSCPLVTMMKDQYANYVVQKMLDVVDEDQRGLLITKIKPHLQSLKRFTYGRHLLMSKSAIIPSRDETIWRIHLFLFITEVEKLLQLTNTDDKQSSSRASSSLDSEEDTVGSDQEAKSQA